MDLKREYEYKVLRFLKADSEKAKTNRTFNSVENIEQTDFGSVRVEVNYTEHFISGEFDDVGIWYIDLDLLDEYS